MSEQKAVPEIPEDLREMYESSKLDTTMFVGSQIRQLIGRIAALTAERDSAKRELAEIQAGAAAERKKYEALERENAALKATVERLSAPWTKGVDAFYSERNDTLTGWFDGILAARTTPPAKEPK